LIALLQDGEFNSLGSGKFDPLLLAFTNDKDVFETCGEVVSLGILDVNDIEGSRVLVDSRDGSDTALVSTTGDEGKLSNVEFQVANRLASFEVKFEGIIDFPDGVRVADGAGIVGDDVRDDTSLSGVEGVAAHGGFVGLVDALNADKFEVGLFFVNLGEDESSLVVVQHAVSFVGFVNGDNVHEAARIVNITADLAIDADEAAGADDDDLTAGEGILQTIAENQRERHAFSELVRTLRRTRGPDASKFV